MIYLRLFWEFFKTGLFSVGGGLATLPFIYDMSDRTGWFTDLFFWKGLLLAAVIWALTNVVKPTKKLHPIVYIAASAVVGIVFSFAGV